MGVKGRDRPHMGVTKGPVGQAASAQLRKKIIILVSLLKDFTCIALHDYRSDNDAPSDKVKDFKEADPALLQSS